MKKNLVDMFLTAGLTLSAMGCLFVLFGQIEFLPEEITAWFTNAATWCVKTMVYGTVVVATLIAILFFVGYFATRKNRR